jgi:hypothetical protein
MQSFVSSVDHVPGPAVLFDRQAQIIHSNEKARSFFSRPLVTRQDLPAELTAGLQAVLQSGRRSFSCYQRNVNDPALRKTLFPEYLDTARPEEPTCALLTLEDKPRGSVPPFIAMLVVRELRDGCVPLSAFRNDPGQLERAQNEPDWRDAQKGAAEYAIMRTTRVANALWAVRGGDGRYARETVSLGSSISEADEWNFKFQQSQFPHGVVPMELVCQGPDLVFSTCNNSRVKSLFTEILVDVRTWSKSASIHWEEDHHTLGVPAARIELTFNEFPHTVPYISSRNEGLGLAVAREILMDANGRMEVTPGKPATLCLWLPLTLPETF